MASTYRDVTVENMGGFLDREREPNQTGAQHYRLLLNAMLRGSGRRCRRGGWRKLFDEVNEAGYNNEDLHDQLIGLQIYYQEFQELIPPTQSITGYQYAIWFPGVNVPNEVYVYEQFIDCLYGPDLPASYMVPWNSTGAGWQYDLPIKKSYVYGNYVLDTEPYEPCSIYIPYYGAYYEGNQVYLRNVGIIEGYQIPGYGYGDYLPVYDFVDGYINTYCGTDMFGREGCSEAITFIGDIGNNGGKRTLVAATKSRIYALNNATGNWRIVADGLGSPQDDESQCDTCSPEKWMSANLDNIMILTNGLDPVLSYSPLNEPDGCDLWRASEIEDLDTLNVSSAGCVGEWKGFIFLGDVFQDGAKQRNRIIWSDFNNPYSYIPADDSLAGFQDLGNDETILRIEPIADFLFIYTDRSIYRAVLITGTNTASFAFEEIYRGKAALKYKWSLVNTGEAHFYFSENRMLRMQSFDKRPQELDWMKMASTAIFTGLSEDDLSFGPLNSDECEHFIGGYNPRQQEVWFSWPTDNNTCPNMSMVFNMTSDHLGADFVDHGFTAFHWYDGVQQITVFEWLESLEICAREDLLTGFVKEGLPIKVTSDAFVNPPSYVYNLTEDPDLPPGDDSVCRRMEDSWIQDFCRDCSTLSRFVMASAEDYCLKEYADDSYYREQLQNGTYQMVGYDTVFQSGVDQLKTEEDKTIRKFIPEFTAIEQTTPNTLYAYIAYGPQPSCMIWKQLKFYDENEVLQEGRPLRCLTDKQKAEHEADGTIPDLDAKWDTKLRGKYIGWRLKITGTGGGSCFSKVHMKIEPTEKS